MKDRFHMSRILNCDSKAVSFSQLSTFHDSSEQLSEWLNNQLLMSQLHRKSYDKAEISRIEILVRWNLHKNLSGLFRNRSSLDREWSFRLKMILYERNILNKQCSSARRYDRSICFPKRIVNCFIVHIFLRDETLSYLVRDNTSVNSKKVFRRL